MQIHHNIIIIITILFYTVIYYHILYRKLFFTVSDLQPYRYRALKAKQINYLKIFRYIFWRYSDVHVINGLIKTDSYTLEIQNGRRLVSSGCTSSKHITNALKNLKLVSKSFFLIFLFIFVVYLTIKYRLGFVTFERRKPVIIYCVLLKNS